MPSNLRRVFTSSIGTKLLIGVTGLALFAYMVLHLAGNALIFLGEDTFNEYSHKLISNPLIVPIEIGLLLVFLLHVYKALTMWFANQARYTLSRMMCSGRAPSPSTAAAPDRAVTNARFLKNSAPSRWTASSPS